MSTTEESEATTDAADDAADLLPTGTVVQAEPTAEEPPEGGLTSEAAAEMLPSGAAGTDEEPSEPDPPTVDVEVLDEDDLFDEEEPAPKRESAYDRPGNWYVVHTQSGYEKKVRQNLQARAASMHLEDRILEVETFLPVADETHDVVPKRSKARFGYDVGETVRVKEGPFADFSGAIVEINEDQLKVKVLVNIFGRETPVELEFSQVAQL